MDFLKGREYIKSFTFESKIRNGAFSEKNKHANRLWKELINVLNDSQIKIVNDTKFLAENIDYRHAGLSPAEYFLHAFRVGSLGGLLNIENRVLATQVGLLHNVYEVTELDRSFIAKHFGLTIDLALHKLTINRKLQTNLEYLSIYYNDIAKLPQNLGIIKIIDKIDNLYSLNITASAIVKERYMHEIDKFLLPLCKTIAPFLLDTLNQAIGHIEYN